MGFRFWKRVNILPGVTLNLSKSGPSLTVGPRGARVTVGSRGTRATVGVPGTGLSYTTKLGGSKPKTSSSRRKTQTAKTQRATRNTQTASTDFFDNLQVAAEDKSLIAACRELAQGNDAAALEQLRSGARSADAAFLAGSLALKLNQTSEAASFLAVAQQREGDLGKTLSKYGVEPALDLPITEEIAARIGPDARGLLLALAEVYERQGQRPQAIESLRHLVQLSPSDVMARVSLAELLLETEPVTQEARQEVVRLSEDIENDTPVHTAMLLFKAKALRTLGLTEAAQTVVAQAMRRKKDRPADLLAGLRFERGLLYEAEGQADKARSEFEQVYAASPGYEDVAARLGL